jgi:hypothetical protein
VLSIPANDSMQRSGLGFRLNRNGTGHNSKQK